LYPLQRSPAGTVNRRSLSSPHPFLTADVAVEMKHWILYAAAYQLQEVLVSTAYDHLLLLIRACWVLSRAGSLSEFEAAGGRSTVLPHNLHFANQPLQSYYVT
jgi:hypothetical protein